MQVSAHLVKTGRSLRGCDSACGAGAAPFPSNFFDFFAGPSAFAENGSNGCAVSVAPGRLHQNPTQVSIASFGGGTALHPFSTGTLARHCPDVPHELSSPAEIVRMKYRSPRMPLQEFWPAEITERIDLIDTHVDSQTKPADVFVETSSWIVSVCSKAKAR